MGSETMSPELLTDGVSKDLFPQLLRQLRGRCVPCRGLCLPAPAPPRAGAPKPARAGPWHSAVRARAVGIPGAGRCWVLSRAGCGAGMLQ